MCSTLVGDSIPWSHDIFIALFIKLAKIASLFLKVCCTPCKHTPTVNSPGLIILCYLNRARLFQIFEKGQRKRFIHTWSFHPRAVFLNLFYLLGIMDFSSTNYVVLSSFFQYLMLSVGIIDNTSELTLGNMLSTIVLAAYFFT